MVNKRAVSAPNLSMMSFGSTTLFFDFDIFSTPPMMTGKPSSSAVAFTGRLFSSHSTVTCAG
ncbi:hypothetical protein D3C76_1264200 [compost metagenome]